MRLRRISGKILGFVVCWIGIIKRELNERKGWLSYQASLFKKKREHKPLWVRLVEEVSSLVLPRPGTAIGIVATVVALHFLFQWLNLTLPFINAPENADYSFLHTLWSVQIGITAVLVPVTVFVIGLARDEGESATRTSAVLIRQSWIIPIVTFSILTTVYFSWYLAAGSVGQSGVLYLLILVSLNASLAIFLYYRIMYLLLNTFALRQKSIVLLKEKMKRSIGEAIRERVGNNILLRNLGADKIQLEYSYFSLGGRDRFRFVESDKLGYVKDIHLGRLRMVSTILESEGRKKDRSFSKNALSPGDRKLYSPSETEPAERPTETKELVEDKERFLLRRLHDRVDQEHKGLVCFRNDLVDESIFERVQKMTLSAFKIQQDEINFSQTFVQELGYLKDNTLRAITEERTDALESNLETYASLVEVFLDILREYGANYSFEMTQKELSGFGGWDEIEWIQSNLKEFVDRGFATNNKTVIRKVIYFPVRLAASAISHMDYFVFQKFISWVPHFFLLATKMNDKEMGEFVATRCRLHLRDFIELDIEARLRKQPLDEERLPRLEEFAVGLILTFNQLLKRACDSRDLGSFRLFGSKLNSLFSHFTPSSDFPDSEDYERQLAYSNLTEEQKQEIATKLRYQQKLENVEHTINLRRKQVWLGLRGWIIRNYEEGRLDERTFGQLYSAITDFRDLGELTKVFMETHSHESEELFGWDWWLLEDRPAEQEDEASSVDFSNYLSWVYCFGALQLIKGIPGERIKAYSLPTSRDLVFLAEKEDSKIQQILRQIGENPERWKAILKSEDLRRIPDLIGLLKKAAEEQRKAEAEELIRRPLDKDKIEQFKKEIIEEWKRSASLRRIVRGVGHFHILDVAAPTEIPRYGRNVIEHKAAFVRDWHIHYPQWGEDYGRRIAGIENTVILSEIGSKILSSGSGGIDAHQTQNALNQAIENLSREGYEPNAILISDSWDLIPAIRQAPGFGEPDLEESSCVGSYQDVPVFNLFETEPRGVYVLDLKKLGEWKQYVQQKSTGEEELMADGIFTFYIKQYDEKKANGLIEAQPEMLREPQTDNELDRNFVVRRLLQRVNIKLFEQFQYEIRDVNAGLKIPLSCE